MRGGVGVWGVGWVEVGEGMVGWVEVGEGMVGWVEVGEGMMDPPTPPHHPHHPLPYFHPPYGLLSRAANDSKFSPLAVIQTYAVTSWISLDLSRYVRNVHTYVAHPLK